MTLSRLLSTRLAPARTAHAWFDGAPGASGGAAVADPAPADPPAAGDPPADPPKAGAPDISTIQKELAEARREAAKHRTDLKRFQDAEEARQTASLSEVDRLKKELADSKAAAETAAAQAKAGRLSGASLAAAARLGFADPEDAQRFLDADKVDWSDDGAPTNVQALLEAVLNAKPYLKASFTQPPDLGQGARGRAGIPLTRDAIAKMTPAEINARWDEVQEVMKKG